MSCKVPLNNTSFKVPSVDLNNVKLAGEEAKDRLYEPKHKKKAVRVLTVVAYVFFVSLAGIMLSLYYVFIWNGHLKEHVRVRTIVVPVPSKCDQEMLQMRLPLLKSTVEELSMPTTTEDLPWLVDSTNFSDYSSELEELSKRSVFMQKIFKRPLNDMLK